MLWSKTREPEKFMNTEPIHIVSLTAENVQILKAVRITPDGNLVVIGGRNGQGKSSVLDSIWWALGGEGALPEKPVRAGEDKATLTIELGGEDGTVELVVVRTVTEGGTTTLKVTGADGKRLTSPQEVLNKMVQTLVGLDFTEYQKARKEIYDDRTVIGRDLNTLQGQLTGTQFVPGVPEVEVSTAGVIDEQQKANATNTANADARLNERTTLQAYLTTQETTKTCEGRLNETVREISRLRELQQVQENSWRAAKQLEADAQMVASVAHQAAVGLQDVDLLPFKTRLSNAETTNISVRSNKARTDLTKKVDEKDAAYKGKTAEIVELDKARDEALSSAQFPVEGLGFTAAEGRNGEVTVGLVYKGLPFAQANTATKTRVSVALGLALNPKLRVLLIRNGSDLDEESLEMVRSMAEAAKAQIWMERVSTGAEVSVIIEDGEVAVKK